MAKKDGGLLKLPKLFIPETLTFTHSLKKDWLACRRKFLLNYLARLSSKRLVIPFFIGGYFHKGLEKFYKGEDPEEFIPELVVDMETKAKKAVFLSPEEEEKLAVASAIVEGMLYSYCRHYAKDLKRWQIVQAEFRFSVPIVEGVEYTGQLDLIVKEGGDYWIVEHKTVGRLDKAYVDRLPLDTQITGYAIGAKHSLKVPIKGVIYNVARKPQIRPRSGETNEQFANRVVTDYAARPDFYFYREQLFRDSSETILYKREVAEMIADIQEKLQLVRKGDQGEIAAHFHRNTDNCTLRGTCQFLDICTKGWNKLTASRYDVRPDFNPELKKEDDTED